MVSKKFSAIFAFVRMHRMPFWLSKLYKTCHWRLNPNEKSIYLTFDDGPDPEVTPFVLAELKSYNAKATFFAVGENIQKYPTVSEDIIRQGHELANHTMNHLKGWNYQNKEYIENVELCRSELTPYSNNKLFRPPYGRIKKSQIKELNSKGYHLIMWDIISYDYDKHLHTTKALKEIIQKTRNGSIVVFHDSQKAKHQLMKLLPSYLEEMKDRGYRFEIITEEVLDNG